MIRLEKHGMDHTTVGRYDDEICAELVIPVPLGQWLLKLRIFDLNDLHFCVSQTEAVRVFFVKLIGLKRIVASIGLPDARLHDLRHSYAVASIRAGDDIKTVQGNLGHHTAAFTLDVYGHVTEEMKKASAERMETYIKSISGL